MRISDQITDAAVFEELGSRLGRARLAAGLSQAELAARAGVSERTVRALESGSGGQLRTLVRILRELGLVESLDRLVPEGGPSPIELADLRRRERQRAPRRRPPDSRTAEPWRWGDVP